MTISGTASTPQPHCTDSTETILNLCGIAGITATSESATKTSITPTPLLKQRFMGNKPIYSHYHHPPLATYAMPAFQSSWGAELDKLTTHATQLQATIKKPANGVIATFTKPAFA